MPIKQKHLSVDEFKKLVDSLPSTVNVIGNSRSLLSHNYGNDIDKHYTIRFNWPDFRKHRRQLGNRLDWIQTSHPKFARMRIPAYYNDSNVKLVSWRPLDSKYNTRSVITAPEMLVFPDDVVLNYWNEYQQSTESKMFGKQKPSTGYYMLKLFDDFRPDLNVNIYGFDFKETDSYYIPKGIANRVVEKNHAHNYEFEKTEVIKIANKNNWTIV